MPDYSPAMTLLGSRIDVDQTILGYHHATIHPDEGILGDVELVADAPQSSERPNLARVLWPLEYGDDAFLESLINVVESNGRERDFGRRDSVELSRTEVLLYSAVAFALNKTASLFKRIFRPEPKTDFLDKNSVVVVTGASQGVGAILVRELAAKSRGKIVLVARKQREMEDLVTELQPSSPATFHVVPMDLGRYDSANDLSVYLIENKLIPTVLVYNAGYNSGRTALEMARAERDMERNVNVVTPMELMIRLGPLMETAPGKRKIIYVGSMMAYVPSVGNATYGGTRADMSSFVDSFNLETGVDFPRVHYISLGQVATAPSERFRHPLVPLSSADEAAAEIERFVVEQNPPLRYTPGRLNKLILLANLLSSSLTLYMGGVVTGTYLRNDLRGKYRRKK
jgi:short-subunit dehydrogenase